MEQTQPITTEAVERIARLALLKPSESEIARYRDELASILEYVSRLQELDVERVEPLTHPASTCASVNRLAVDDSHPPLAIAALEMNAPAMEGRYITVPKVINDGTEGG